MVLSLGIFGKWVANIYITPLGLSANGVKASLLVDYQSNMSSEVSKHNTPIQRIVLRLSAPV